MPMDAHDIESMIKAAIPDAEVTIRDLAGDGDHYAATVISGPPIIDEDYGEEDPLAEPPAPAGAWVWNRDNIVWWEPQQFAGLHLVVMCLLKRLEDELLLELV